VDYRHRWGLTTAFADLCGFGSLRLHWTMIDAVATSLSLVVVLIVALDWPFRGEVSVSPDAYVDVEHGWTLTANDRE
jgi:hypothetical protein